MHINRKTAQIISSFFFITGFCHFFTREFEIGAILTGTAFYIMIFSESIFLQKVQSEMAVVLECLRKKQDKEIQDLLYFLRSSKINSAPYDSWDGAKLFLCKVPSPAFLMSPDMTIVKANQRMYDLLGYKKGYLDGQPAARINYLPLMSVAGVRCREKQYHSFKDMSMRYMYLTKDGSQIRGLLTLKKIVDGGFFMTFIPDIEHILTDADIDAVTA